jgi:hypothetical protein
MKNLPGASNMCYMYYLALLILQKEETNESNELRKKNCEVSR